MLLAATTGSKELNVCKSRLKFPTAQCHVTEYNCNQKIQLDISFFQVIFYIFNNLAKMNK